MSTRQSNRAEILNQFPEPKRQNAEYTGDAHRRPDATDIRMVHGIPSWEPGEMDFDVLEDLLVHSWEPPRDLAAGGTDVFIRGKPGVGKSTLLCYLAARLLDINDETVFWRASSSRSEWMPLAPWATVWLPAGADIDARLTSRDPRDNEVDLDVEELEEIVRDVRRYREPRDVLDRAAKGQFHVIYPDPQMRGCQGILDESAERAYETPSGRDTLFHEEDPDHHWWFAFNLARVEHGPHHWSTWICDEIGDLVPQNCRKDKFGTYQKVMLLRDSWVDFRKHGHTIFGAGHSEKDVHQVIRHKLRWRIQMPRQANPKGPSDVVGFDSIPMDYEMTARMPIGKAICYTETSFAKFKWKDMESPTSHKLKITIK